MKLHVDHTNPIRVGLISLGCAKNLVDAEIMLGSLLQNGIQVINEAAQADVVIVNTCSFIDAAQEESVDAILESGAFREAHCRGQALVVSGCLSQRFREELPKLLPEVDAFMGIDQVTETPRIVREALDHRRRRVQREADAADNPSRRRWYLAGELADLDRHRPGSPGAVAEVLGGTNRFGRTPKVLTAPEPPQVEVHARPKSIPDYSTPRVRLTPGHFAYVKIAEGCNHPCSFCVIPRIRGSHRSRAQAGVVEEVRLLLAEGVREINLISQDSTYYGLDLRPQRSGSIAAPDRFHAAARALPAGATTLSSLLRELDRLPGEFWIRLLYTHPAHWTDELIRTFANCPKVVRYVDMPLQHIHDLMLERMRRETTREYIVDLIDRIRRAIPGIALRTTFIVGFPGETDRCFESLLEFIRTTRFERLGVFTYSPEEGTRAARMAGQVPDKLKQERRDRAMAEQLQVTRQLTAAQVGRTLRVLTEGAASGQSLPTTGLNSSEHGLIRSDAAGAPLLRGSWTLARGETDAPDIDGRVFVRGVLPIGEFVRVRVVEATDYDLVAELSN